MVIIIFLAVYECLSNSCYVICIYLEFPHGEFKILKDCYQLWCSWFMPHGRHMHNNLVDAIVICVTILIIILWKWYVTVSIEATVLCCQSLKNEKVSLSIIDLTPLWFSNGKLSNNLFTWDTVAFKAWKTNILILSVQVASPLIPPFLILI